jgi:hypothetical protein
MAERWRGIGIAGRATALAALPMLVAGLAVFVPYLIRSRTVSAGVPAPPALFAATEYVLAPGRSACMSSVAVEAGSRVARFAARPAAAPAGGGGVVPGVGRRASSGPRPPVQLTITAPGYRASGLAPAGTGYKMLAVAIEPPRQALIGSVCFTDRGGTGVALEGSDEARTVSRSPTVLAGTAVAGDIALAFTQLPRRSLLSSLDELFARASALTEGLLPVWLIWCLAVLVAVGMPVGTLAALHRALQEDRDRPDGLAS